MKETREMVAHMRLEVVNCFIFTACMAPCTEESQLMYYKQDYKQSHKAEHWCIMANFKVLAAVILRRKGGCGLKFVRP